MKKKINLLLMFAFAAVILFSTSCKTSSVSMQVLVPGIINVPQDIKKVGIINRSLPAKGSNVQNILEGIFSGESIMADREGSKNCVHGLSNQLNESPRFEAILLESLDLRGTGTKRFATPLHWNVVANYCELYDLDALVVLETFDSDISYREHSRKRNKKVDDKKVEYTEYIANLLMNVNAGWRIYDIKNRKIVDEDSYMDDMEWHMSGDTPEEARHGLPQKRNAINKSGYHAGKQYGIRISPSWMHVSRAYYARENDDFKLAKRMVKSQNWEAAAKVWEKYTNNPDPKVAGFACYNMALANEMQGELEIALNWADKAMKKYGLKRAVSYVNILNRRIMDQERLRKQMDE